VKLYIKTTPSKRIAEDKLPNKKYFNPAEIADSLSRYKETKNKIAKHCNPIDKNIEIISLLKIKQFIPNTENNAIIGYSSMI